MFDTDREVMRLTRKKLEKHVNVFPCVCPTEFTEFVLSVLNEILKGRLSHEKLMSESWLRSN